MKENKQLAAREGIETLLKRANEGDQKALAEVRTLFDANPAAWKILGDAGQMLREQILDALIKTNPISREVFLRKLVEMKQELLLPGATPLEGLCAERVCICWLAVMHADLAAARVLTNDKASLRQGEYYRKVQESAHRRFASAVKTLALVRRLQVPSVTVNIAREQTNVVATVAQVKPEPSRPTDGRHQTIIDADRLLG